MRIVSTVADGQLPRNSLLTMDYERHSVQVKNNLNMRHMLKQPNSIHFGPQLFVLFAPSKSMQLPIVTNHFGKEARSAIVLLYLMTPVEEAMMSFSLSDLVQDQP